MSSEECLVWAGVAWVGASLLLFLVPVSGPSRRRLRLGGRGLLAAGLAVALIGFGLRWRSYTVDMGESWLLSFPVVTLYESLSFIAMVFLAAWLCARHDRDDPWLAGLVPLVSGVLMLALSIFPIPDARSLFLPSLKSYWLIAHVALSFIAYALFGLAALISLLALLRRTPGGMEKVRLLLKNGILIFTVGGLVLGAVWAHSAWGRFWAWDPKETWAFVTWCIYLLLWHVDTRIRLSDRALAWGSMIGFAAVLFTYVGVNLMFHGLHSYALL